MYVVVFAHYLKTYYRVQFNYLYKRRKCCTYPQPKHMYYGIVYVSPYVIHT